MEEDEERKAGKRGEEESGGLWAYNLKHPFFNLNRLRYFIRTMG